MSRSKSRYVSMSGIPVELVRKRIKHLYIRVDPSDGQVRISAPLRMDDETVHRAVVPRLDWIRRRRRLLQAQGGQIAPSLVSGERQYFQGRPYRLNLVEHRGSAAVRIVDDEILELRVRPGTDVHDRRAVLESWYRQHLRTELPRLIRQWEPLIGVRVAEWRIRKMKTRWGTCNISARRIWMNLALARESPSCLEYVLVHEMVHLLEQRHNDRFRAYMDRFMPDWRIYRRQLNRDAP